MAKLLVSGTFVNEARISIAPSIPDDDDDMMTMTEVQAKDDRGVVFGIVISVPWQESRFLVGSYREYRDSNPLLWRRMY